MAAEQYPSKNYNHDDHTETDLAQRVATYRSKCNESIDQGHPTWEYDDPVTKDHAALIYKHGICGYIEFAGKDLEGNNLYRAMARVDHIQNGAYFQPVSEMPYPERTAMTMVEPCMGYFLEADEEKPHVVFIPFDE